MTVKTHNGVSTYPEGGEKVVATCVVNVVAAPADIELNTTTINIGYKETYKGLKATLIPPEGEEECAGTLKWASGNSNYVKVNADGWIYGAKAGKAAYVYVQSHNGITKRCAVYVKKAPTKFAIAPTTLTLSAGGQTAQLKWAVNSGAASGACSFTSSDAKVATVDENGLITSVNPGTATITVKTYNGKAATCKVTVYGEPAQVMLSQSEANIAAEQKLTLKASVVSADGAASIANYTYGISEDSANPDCIKLNAETGEIVGVKRGQAIVTVTTHNGVNTHEENGKVVKTTCVVNVIAAPADIELNTTTINIGYKETYKGLKATLIPPEGEDECAGTLKWASGNSNYVKVNADGWIYGAKAGKAAYVYVQSHNGITKRCAVYVKKAPTKFAIAPTTLTLSAGGQTAQLKWAVNSGAASGAYSFTSSDAKVATVDENGLITSVNPGTATITVKTYNGKAATCKVTVYGEPAQVSFNEKTMRLGEGQTGNLSVTVKDAEGKETIANLTYAVDDPTVLEVNASTGAVKGLKSGRAVVTVKTHNGVSTYPEGGEKVVATCVVNVVAAPADIELNTTTINIGYKETYKGLKATLIPPEGEEECAGTLKWASGNSNYVKVNADGWIYGAKAGKAAYVYVQSHNGITKRCAVYVKKAPTKFAIAPTTLTLSAGGQTAQLKWAVNSGAASGACSFTSSDAKVATVDENGLITSVNPGTATITVKTYNGKAATCKVTVYGEPAQVMLSQSEANIAAEQKLTLKASVVSADGAASIANYTYGISEDSANPDCIKLNAETGEIVGVKRGQAIVTVTTHNGVNTHEENGVITKTTCVVNVVAAPADIELNETTLYIGYKETYKGLKAKLIPPKGEEECAGTLTWASGNSNYVKVNADGWIYGAKAGKAAYVYVQSHNGITKRCAVYVRNAPSKVALNQSSLTLAEGGQTYQLNGIVNSGAASAFTFSSSNPEVATVSANGLVTSVGIGTATITGTSYNGKKATCVVTVVAAPEQVFLPETITVAVGQAGKVTGTVLGPNNSDSVANYTYSAVDGTGSITINSTTGEVKGVRPGTAYIKVKTHNGVTTHQAGDKRVETVCEVKIVDAPVDIKINVTTLTMGVGETFTIEPVMIAPDGSEMTGGTFSYARSGSAVSVSASGVVKAAKTGTSYVRVSTYNGLYVDCKFVVKKAPSKVTISPTKATLGVGQTGKYKVALPSGSAGSYIFASSNPEVASVDNEGNVVALAVGTTTIAVKTYNGKIAKSALTVKKAPEFMILNADCYYDEELLANVYYKIMMPGSTFQLKYTNEYQTVGNVVSYTSLNPEVATVSGSGLIKAVKSGISVIEVTSSSGVSEYCTIFVMATSGELTFETSNLTLGVEQVVPVPNLYGDIDELEAMFIEYEIDKTAVAELDYDEDGLLVIKAVGVGTATLTAYSATGLTGSMTITVRAKPGNLSISTADKLMVGESADVTVTYDSVGTYELFTSDENVAVITEDGRLQGVSHGTVDVTAILHTGESKSQRVTVYEAPESVRLNANQLRMGQGDTYTLEPQIAENSYTTYSYSSSNANVARVSSDGLVTAVSAGTARITVRTAVNGVFDFCDITVVDMPEKIEVVNGDMQMPVGGQSVIEVALTRNDGKDCHAMMRFESDKPEVAAVDANGVVNAVGVGEATITVKTSNGLTESCKVTVKSADEILTIVPEVLHLNVGGADGKFDVSLSSGDTIASVSSDNETIYGEVSYADGVVTVSRPSAAGKATLTVTTTKGLTATCALIISDAPSAMQPVDSIVRLGVGETHAIDVTFTPENAWAQLTYESSNTAVAAVDAQGSITAINAGSTTISIYNADKTLNAQMQVYVSEAPVSIQLSQSEINLCAGMTWQIESPVMAGETGLAGGSFTYAVENSDIAHVDDNGLITAKQVGETMLRVRAYNGVSASMKIIVTGAPTSIHFAESEKQMALNETFVPEVFSENGSLVQAQFSTDHPEIISVDDEGRLVANDIGEAVVTAHYGELTATLNVKVLAATTKVVLNAQEITLGAREKFELAVTLDANTASAGIEFKSTDATVASVDANGIVTARRAGDVQITATAFGGATAVCTVHVKAAPTKITLEPAEVYASIDEGGIQLKWAYGAPDEGGSVKFEVVENEDVVAVDDNGYVAFLSEGWAQIGVLTYNGKSAVIDVVVLPAPTKVNFEYDDLVILKGDTVQNPITFDYSFANYDITSDNESVVTVDQDGNLSGISIGTATVTVKTHNGLSDACKVQVVEKLEGMKMVPETLSLALGEETDMSVAFTPENALVSLKFECSNPTVVELDEATGHVKGIKEGTCTIQAIAPDGQVANCKVTVGGAKRRMFVAYSYFDADYAHSLYFSQNNANSMSTVFGNSVIDGQGYDITTVKNPSKNSLLRGISSTFADSTDSDVSMIYLCSHGHRTGSSSGYRMSLPGYENASSSPYYYITSKELFSCISQIKGRVVLIIDSCYSGIFINDMRSSLDAEGGRISVLTAASNTNASYYNVKSTTTAVDFFTYFMLYGLGYEEKTHKFDYSLRADSNKSGTVSLSEMFNYARNSVLNNVPAYSKYSWFWGNKNQSPQSYMGDNANLIMYDPK